MTTTDDDPQIETEKAKATVANYPREWETHAVISDGATVEIRPILPTDRQAIVDFHRRQSRESIYFRFFRHRPELTQKELDLFTQVDYRVRMAFVAFEGGELVAVARYEQEDPESHDAEVAFFVDDANHGRGLATLLLEYLAAAARARGITEFTASVLAENYRMLGVFRAAGFRTTTRFVDGAISVNIDLAKTDAAQAVINDRLRRAVSRSVAPLLEPSVVAVVGAGRRPGSLGHSFLASLLGQGNGPAFTGTVLAVNPNADQVLGRRSFPSVVAAADSIEARIDLAIVAVPKERVDEVVADCGAAGVRGIMVVAAGFGDRGADGRAAEQQLLADVRDHGMRMIGPNAFGLANTAADINLNLVSVPLAIEPGPVALASDSGVLAAAVIDQFRLAGTGVSQVVGVGNQVDVAVSDLVSYWALNDPTKVVVLYSDRLGADRTGARELADTALLCSLTKPVLAIRPADDASRQLLAESGVILVDAVSELADEALMLGSQPLPRGDRVAIVSNSDSLGRLTRSACRRWGLCPVVPSSAAAGALDETILIDNLDDVSEVYDLTVAMSRHGTVADYESVIVATGVDEGVDAVILAMVPTEAVPMAELERLADRINRSVDKPTAVVGLYDRSGVSARRLPFYTFPEEAARALARGLAYQRWRSSHLEAMATDHETSDRSPLLDTEPPGRLTIADDRIRAILDGIGIPVAPYRVGVGVDELVEGAGELGYPVVLKLGLGAGTVGELGGTAIDLHDEAEVRTAYTRMSQIWGSALDRAVVQEMIDAQALARLELVRDELGISVAIGFGGSGLAGAEPLDRTFLPTTDQRIAELVGALVDRLDPEAASPAAVAGMEALAARLVEVGRRHPAVQRLVLNPILFTAEAAVPADVELVLNPLPSDPLDEVRRLD